MSTPYSNFEALPRPHFRFQPERAAEAIEVIARARPGLTQYFVGKVLYLADKLHFLDWGRPITFDRYVAMRDGPVPSAVRNMLLAAAGAQMGIDDERQAIAEKHAEELLKRVRVELVVARNGERQLVYAKSNTFVNRFLSRSDLSSLADALNQGGNMSFDQLRGMTHQDDAWREAWDRARGRVADIDISLWAEPEDRAAYRTQLAEYGATF